MMKARVTTIYRLPSIIGLPQNIDLDLVRDNGVHAYLTMNTRPSSSLLDTHAALGLMGLSWLTGGLPGDTPLARYQSAAVLVAQKKPTTEPAGALMIIDIDGDVAEPPHETIGDFGEFSAVMLRLPFPAVFTTKGRTAFERAFVSLALALDENLTATFQKVGRITFMIEPNTNRRIFTLILSGSGRATLSRPLSEATTAAAMHYVSAFTDEQKLGNVIRL